MPRLEFTIAVKPFGAAAQKDAKKLTEELRSQDKETDKLNKATKSFVKDFARGTDEAKKAMGGLNAVFDATAGRIHRFNERIVEGFKRTGEKIKEHLKEALVIPTGLFLARGMEAVFDLPKRLFEAGKGNVEARERLMRQFGGRDAEYMERVSRRVGRRAGFDDAASLTALFPVAEAVDQVQAGTVYGGRKLNESQAAKIRESLFGKGAGLFERITTVMRTSPEEASQIGYLLANAGTGPEGMRGLVSALHLNRAFSARLLAANAKGKGVDLVDPQIARELGLHRGQQIGQGDLLDILLRKSGITEKAAEDERKRFGFQVKSIGATFESALGDVGERVLNKISGGLAKGETFAEKFQKALESPKGKETIDKIADGLVRAVDGAIKLGTEIPKFIGFLESHKTALMLFGGSYLGLSAIGGIKSFGEKVKNLSEGRSANVIHVWVDNPGFGGGGGGTGVQSPSGGGGKLGLASKGLALLQAGAAGYAFGSALDETFDISGHLTGTAEGDIKNADDAEFARDEFRRKQRRILRSMSSQVPADLRARYDKLTADATAVGTPIEGQYTAAAQLKQMIAELHLQPPAVNVYVGSKQVAAVVEHEQIKRAVDQAPPRG